ncbi:MAG: transposase [Gallionella sp.]|nr:transposase [Gallionella sp.]
MKYSGIDLHSNNSVVAVTDEADRVIAEKRLPNDLAKIIGFLLPWRDELKAVVVESTYNWYRLVDGLQEAGFVVKLANTGAIKKYDGLKHSGDEAGARQLAHLLRLGILPTGTILPPEQRAVRDLARKRMQLARSRTGHILAVENIAARQRAMKINSNQIERLTADAVDQMGLPMDVALAVKSNLAVIITLNGQIDLLETGPIERFAAAGNFASYARCVDSRHMGNNKKKGEGNTKNGNKYLAWAFVEAANFALRFNAEAKRFYERKKAKTNTAVATRALAHKPARACYHMLKENKPFDETRCFA